MEAAPQRTVLLVIPFFTVGGAERIFLSLLREWRRRGVRVVAVTTLQLGAHIPNQIAQVRALTPYVYELAWLFEDREDLQAGFLYFLLRRYKPDFIFTAGSDFLYRYLPAIRRHFPDIAVIDQLFNDQVHLPMNRACAPYIDCTSVPGERFARRLVEEFGESPQRVAVVRQCIRLPRTSGVRPPAGWPAGFEGKPVAGFFGRISPEKAPFDFLEIAKKIVRDLPAARFVMAGDGPDLEAVRRRIRKLGLTEIVHAAGFVEGVHDWMDACGIVILCSKIDGMPLTVLEAQALGKPVVASRVGSVPEMILDGETGVLCEPGDTGAFASAAVRLLTDKALRERMGEAARRHIYNQFREEIMLEQYFRLFERIAGRSSGGPLAAAGVPAPQATPGSFTGR
jgi:glycosyltransferase involved in cell wall biosynthesis